MERRTLLRTLGSIAGAGSLLGSTVPVAATTGSFTEEYYGDERYLKYVPSGADRQRAVPLVTMETENPEQCWNWFDHENHVRGSGETALIDSIT